MKLTPLAPAGQAGNEGPRWSVAASVLLHLLALALVLGIAARESPQGGPAEPSYDLVFEGPPQSPESSPPQRADVPVPDDAPIGTPTPPPSTPPVPDASGTAQPEATQGAPPAEATPPPVAQPTPPAPTPAERPVPKPAERPAPPVARTVPAPTPTTATPPPPVAAPPADPATTTAPSPVEVLPEPAPPEVRLQVPEEQAPREQAEEAPIMPQPPPPLPPEPQRVRPVPRTLAGPRAPPGSFANPMDLSLAPGPAPARRGVAMSRGIDLTVPLAARGPSQTDPYAKIRAANASADWNKGLLQYWLAHRFYPQQAAENNEQGSVTIELTVARSGAVESVRVLSPSGSQWLDMAAVGTFRGGHLPPFTEEMREDRITFPVPITYYLVRR